MRWTHSFGALLAAGLLLLAGCPTGKDNSNTEDKTPQVSTGGEISLPLTIARDDPVLTGLDFSDPRLFALARCIGLPLVKSDATGFVSPGLAASWESNDFVSWKFVIDTGLKADEPEYAARLFETRVRAILAGDECSLRAQLTDLIDGAAAYAKGTAPGISGIVIDGDTLNITLTRKFAQFPLWLSQPGLCLVDANPLADGAGETADAQLCIGLFAVAEVTDTSIKLIANPDSLRGKPQLDEITFVLEPDLERQAELFLAGDLDAANLPGAGLADLDPAAGEVVRLETAEMILGFFNLSHFPWQDSQFHSKLGLRQALNYGLNLATLAEETDGSLEPWPHFLPPALKNDIPAGLVRQPTFPIPEQLEDARAGLRRADHWQGSHLIPGMDLTYLKDQGLNDAAVSILEFWNDISVAMRPHQTTMDDLRVRVELGTHEIILCRFAPAYSDSGAFAYPLLYSKFKGLGGNWLMLEDDTVDEMIRETQATSDDVLREKKFQQLSQYLEDNALLVFIGYATPSIAVSSRLGGLELNPYDFDASLQGQDFAKLGVIQK